MRTSKQIIGIMATTKEGVVGSNKNLPWNYPSETEHFQNTVIGHTVVMGQKSYAGFPKNLAVAHPLVILSRNRQLKIDRAKIVCSIEECLNYLETLDGKIFMIGGGEIANLFLKHNLISSFILTIINGPYKGDSYIDLSFFDKWSKIIIKSCDEYTVFELINPD